MGHFYGILPFSRQTLPFQGEIPSGYLEDCQRIRNLVEEIPPEWNIIATSRAAIHFVGKNKVRLVGHTNTSDYYPDLICLDLFNRWGQSKADIEKLLISTNKHQNYQSHRIGNSFLILIKKAPTRQRSDSITIEKI